MDFIPELPNSNGFDNVLVIVDKLTKYAIFIPCTTSITEVETVRLFSKHVIANFGIPKQIISHRDPRWRNDFWGEVCRLMGMKRALTTAYHPQADGQTEVLNQNLEIALRAYVGPSRDDWVEHLDGLKLAYNSTPHSSTGFSPTYLMRDFHPITGSTLLSRPDAICRPHSGAKIDGGDEFVIDPQAQHMADEFEANRNRAKEALLLAQIFQKRSYNHGRLTTEFEGGDMVLLNPHPLNLLRNKKERETQKITNEV